MKQIDNRQKQHILGRAAKALKGGIFSLRRKKEKIHVPEPPEKSSQDAASSEAPSEQAASAPRSPKVGRNEPCPCGSGKKFKKCCLSKS